MALTPQPLAVVAAVFEANQNSPALLELVDDSICVSSTRTAISTLILNSYRRFTVLAGVESDSAGDFDFLGHAFSATDAAQWH
jgi:hypothetical protein